jgi:hypothetical protein
MSDMAVDSGKAGSAHDNLLEILDNVIHQLDFSKKLLVITVASFFTVVPITAIVINVIANRSDLQFVIPLVTVLVFAVWLAVGVRQWVVFSKWQRRYQEFKLLQKKVDESLDFETSTKKDV